MPLNGFTPNTKIESAKVGANFTNFQNHGLNFCKQFIFAGTLAVQTGTDYISLPDTAQITRVDLIVTANPVGATIIVDIEYSDDNGGSWTTVFTGGTNRPLIADGSKTGNTTTIDVPSVVKNTRLYRAKVAQVGSTTAGSNLSILMKGTYTLD